MGGHREKFFDALKSSRSFSSLKVQLTSEANASVFVARVQNSEFFFFLHPPQCCRRLRRDLARPVGVIICFQIPLEMRFSHSSCFLPGLAKEKNKKKNPAAG